MFNEIQEFVGKKVKSISGLEVGSENVTFEFDDGSRYFMYHLQDCCESVSVEDICGDVDDLIGGTVSFAEEVVSEENPEDATVNTDWQDSFTWTFYKIDTEKGGVTIRWYGESNGYYSESVYIEKEKQ